MSAQNANGNINSIISREALNSNIGVVGSPGACNTNASLKSNSKMSIDHQATLDKGLKMKIKRTKPGTKSSEAKHEIVKATDQQNGLCTDKTNINCNSSINEHDLSSSSLNIQSTTNKLAASSNITIQVGNNSSGNKKNVASNSQLTSCSISSNSGNSSFSNASGSGTNCQLSLQNSKRGSSSHRREKVKEKISHSNREKSSIINSEKEQEDKGSCSCTENSMHCSSSSCVHVTESITTNQRSTVNNNPQINSVPPGVFTPSADATSTVVSTSSILSASNITASPISILPQLNKNGSANAPGPPSKEIASNTGNIKISSHIAAQLAAAAANVTTTNTESDILASQPETITGESVFNPSPTSKKGPGLISDTVHHTKSNSSSTSTRSEIISLINNTQLKFVILL